MPCCRCNGANARCRSCECVKKGRICTSCHVGKHGHCGNSEIATALQPAVAVAQEHPSSATSSSKTPSETPPPVRPPLLSSPLLALLSIADFSLSQSLPIETSQSQQVFIGSQSEPQLPHNDIQSAQQQSDQTIVSPSRTSTLPLAIMGQHFSHQSSSQQAQTSQDRISSRTRSKKHCVVEGCLSFIAPSMWGVHMSLHAQGILRGVVPISWLEEHNSYICPHCSRPVSNSRMSSHSRNCSGVEVTQSQITNQPSNSSNMSSNTQQTVSLPTFEEVCQLNLPTLRFIPSKSRPAFARALSSALRCVIKENTEEAWLKLFMLPKCVLPSAKRCGRHEKLHPIDFLCNLWANNDLTCLWNLAKGRANKLGDTSSRNQNNLGKPIEMAVSLGRCGMLGKACRTLQSSGIAPNDETTWQLLKAKNPSSDIPIIPNVHTSSVSLDSNFDIGAVLRSFPRDTAAGPSGLRIQHLLDVASVHLPTPITSSLREVVNLLVSGKAPQAVSTFMAGGRLVALNKNKEGSPPDIRPIVVGESLRRLAGKCICATLKEKISSFFSSHYSLEWLAGQGLRR